MQAGLTFFFGGVQYPKLNGNGSTLSLQTTTAKPCSKRNCDERCHSKNQRSDRRTIESTQAGAKAHPRAARAARGAAPLTNSVRNRAGFPGSVFFGLLAKPGDSGYNDFQEHWFDME
jgi:hypothetical protein